MEPYIVVVCPHLSDKVIFKVIVSNKEAYLFETRGEAETFIENWNTKIKSW